MKRLVTLSSDSHVKLKQAKTPTIMAMFRAVSTVLGYFTIVIGDYIKIGLSTIVGRMVYYLFGSVVGGCFGEALDVLKYTMKPTGVSFSEWTFGATLADMLYDMVFHKNPLMLGRVLFAELLVSLIYNVLLGTLWLNIMYGKTFLAFLPTRAFKSLVIWPVNSMLFYTIAKTMEAIDTSRITRGVRLTPGNNQ